MNAYEAKKPSVFISYNWTQLEYADELVVKIKDIATVAFDKNNVEMCGSLTELYFPVS